MPTPPQKSFSGQMTELSSQLKTAPQTSAEDALIIPLLKNNAAQEKQALTEELGAVSHNNIEIIVQKTAKEETPPAREVTIDDIKKAGIDVSKKTASENDTEKDVANPEQKEEILRTLEERFLDEPQPPVLETDPIGTKLNAVRGELLDESLALYDQLGKERWGEFEPAVDGFLQKIQDVESTRGAIPTKELLTHLEKLSMEMKTWGKKSLETKSEKDAPAETAPVSLSDEILSQPKEQAETTPEKEVAPVAPKIEDVAQKPEPIKKVTPPETGWVGVEDGKNVITSNAPALGKFPPEKKEAFIPPQIKTVAVSTIQTENTPQTSPKEEVSPDWKGVEDGKNVAVIDVKPEIENTSQKENGAIVSAQVEAQFQKDFALAQEDLKNIVTTVETPEGVEKTVRFSDLTEGQQLLLLENLKDFALDNAKEQALKRFTEREKEKYQSAGFIKKAFLSYTKSYRRAASLVQIEKDILAKPELDKGTYTEVLREMLGMASEAPEAEWKDGKLQVNFALEKDFTGLDLKKLNREKVVQGFNTVAAEFANIPAEWAFSDNETERKKYQESKTAYANARGQLLNLKAEGGKEADALEYTASIDKKIQFTQLFHTHPEVEKIFSETQDQKAWLEGLKAIAKEKGALMALGRSLSALGAGVAISIGSGFTAPLAVALAGGFLGGSASGGIIGWLMAKKRAGLEISDTEKLAEIGVAGPVSDIHTFQQKMYDYDKENNVFIEKAGEEKTRSVIQNGEDLEKKLENALDGVLKTDELKDASKRERMLQTLANRVLYTEEKLRLGLVNFSDGADGFKNRYELLSTLAKARTLHEMNAPATNEKVEQKIIEMMAGQKELVKSGEEEYKSEKIKQGIKYGFLLGGAFGTLFSSLSYAHAHEGNTSPLTPKTPGTGPRLTEKTIVGEVFPNTSALPKASLADEILRKNTFGKNYELPTSAQNVHIPTAHEGTIIPPKIPETEAVKIPKEIFPDPRGHGVVETLSPRQLSIEKYFTELGKVHSVVKGDNIWNVVKGKLVGDGNTEFAKLDARHQNFILDSIKEKIMKSPKEWQEMGIRKDPNLIYPDDKLNLGKVFTSSEELRKIFTRAEHIPASPSTPAVTQAMQPIPVTAPTEIVHPIATPAEAVHRASATEVIHHPTPVKTPPPHHEEPIVLAQNDDVVSDVTPPIHPHALPAHEIATPSTPGHLEAFSMPTNLPLFQTYKAELYTAIHARHPELTIPDYDMRVRDLLDKNPNGLEALKNVYSPQGVVTPKILSQGDLNGSVLDWWTKQAIQHDINTGHLSNHAPAQIQTLEPNAPQMRAQVYQNNTGSTQENIYRDTVETQMNENRVAQETWMNTQGSNPWTVPPGQIPPWVHQEMAQRYPNMPPEMQAQLNQRVMDAMQRDGYNNTAETVTRMSQLLGMRMPVQLGHMHTNDTFMTLFERMAWQTAQGSGHLPANFPNPYSIMGIFGRFMSPNPTDHNIGVTEVSTRVSQAIGGWRTRASIARSSHH